MPQRKLNKVINQKFSLQKLSQGIEVMIFLVLISNNQKKVAGMIKFNSNDTLSNHKVPLIKCPDLNSFMIVTLSNNVPSYRKSVNFQKSSNIQKSVSPCFINFKNEKSKSKESNVSIYFRKSHCTSTLRQSISESNTLK